MASSGADAIAAGVLVGISAMWLATAVALRWLARSQMDFGGGSLRPLSNAQWAERAERSRERQQRQARAWQRLWPVAVGCFVAAVVLAGVAGAHS